MTWREVITNAAAKSKLCSISQQLPANLLQTGKILLKERISQYSNENFLEFARKNIDIELNEEGRAVIGWWTLKKEYREGINFFTVYNDADLPMATAELLNARAYNPNDPLAAMICVQVGPDSYSWRTIRYSDIKATIANMNCFETYPDILVKDLEKVTRCYAVLSKECVEMKFVSFEDYNMFATGSQVYTAIERSNVTTEVMTKCSQKKYRIVYNERFEMDDIDAPLTIPDKWVTLFMTALTVDFAREYPRLSDNTYTMLKERLNEMEHSIQTSSSVSKFIGRYNDNMNISYNYGLNGLFLL